MRPARRYSLHSSPSSSSCRRASAPCSCFAMSLAGLPPKPQHSSADRRPPSTARFSARVRRLPNAIQTVGHPLRSPPDEAQGRLIRRYMQAWEGFDLDGFVELLKEDAIYTMPPLRQWYAGRDAIRDFHRIGVEVL